MAPTIRAAEIDRRQQAGERLGWAMRHYLRILERGDPDACDCTAPLNDQNRTIDHRIPVTSGGSNRLRNLCLACQACNSRKGAMDAPTFRALLAGKLITRDRKPSLVPLRALLSADSRAALEFAPQLAAGVGGDA